MAKLSKLHHIMQVPGAVAAGEFSDDGRLLNYTGNLDEKSAEIAALMCAANKMMGNMQAKGWTVYTGKDGFFPVIGFAVAGGKYAACVMGNAGVFVELANADFDKAFEILSENV
jgi:roadblock/LC7 domain-containing protein